MSVCSLVERATIYFLCGGVPLYLRAFSARDSIESNLCRTILDEWGAPQTDGTNYHQANSTNPFVTYLQATSDFARQNAMGTVYWPGLRTADPYGMETLSGTSPNLRLTEPLVRENGELRPATWNEALYRAAAGFARARDRDATKTFGVFSCSKASNEMNYAAQRFTRGVMLSNNIDSCNRT